MVVVNSSVSVPRYSRRVCKWTDHPQVAGLASVHWPEHLLCWQLANSVTKSLGKIWERL